MFVRVLVSDIARIKKILYLDTHYLSHSCEYLRTGTHAHIQTLQTKAIFKKPVMHQPLANICLV